KIAEVYGKIQKAYEDPKAYKPNKDTEGSLKHDDTLHKEFKRQSVDPRKVKIPETKEQKLPPPKYPDNKKRAPTPAGGWKVKEIPFNELDFQFFENDNEELPLIYRMEQKMSSILDNIRKERKVSNYGGRGIGRRIKISSSQKGKYISYRNPINKPKSLALDATIRNYLKNTIYNQTDIEFPIKFDKYDLMDKIFEYRSPLVLFFVLDSSASMYYVIKQMTDVILSLQKEGYRKRDKISLVIFRGKEAIVLEKPSVYFKKALNKLKNIEGKSYTPMAAALTKCIKLINAEKLKNRNIIPVIFICSDCGANISVKKPDLIAQIQSDYTIIINELKELTKSLSKKGVHLVVLEPKKSYATQGLGVNTYAAEMIKKNFKEHGKAQIFQFDKYNPEKLILELKRIL
ncbi:MAG: VWA domain-containing protein, partial [Candidatus Hodarchaeota archaeon]